MYTILETTTNRVLFSKSDNEVLEGQTAIEQMCMIENPEGKDIFYDFENEIFYLNQ